MADIKLKAGTPQTLEASGGSITNGAAGTADDADLDNTTALAPTYTFVLLAGFGSSVTAGEDIDLYLIPRVDGTNLADVGTNVFAPEHFAGTFITPTTGTTARRMTVQGVGVGPYEYQAQLSNKSGQTVSSGWTLIAYPELGQVG